MIPNRHAMVGAAKKYGEPVRVGTFSAGSGAIVYPAGTVPTDWAVLAKKGAAPGVGWTDITGTSPRDGVNLYQKALTSADLISPATPGSAFCGIVYRDLDDVVFKAHVGQQGPPGSSEGVLGFTKNAQSGGRLALTVGRSAYGSATMTVLTNRVSVIDGTNVWILYEQLGGSSFASGDTVDINWVSSDPNGSGWSMYELRKIPNA